MIFHCYTFFFRQSANSYTIRAGSNFSNSDGVLVSVAAIYAHPEYNETTMNNDIAILKVNSNNCGGEFIFQMIIWFDFQLKSPLKFTQTILPIAIPKSEEKVSVGTKAFISGWGYTKVRMFTQFWVTVIPIFFPNVAIWDFLWLNDDLNKFY